MFNRLIHDSCGGNHHFYHREVIEVGRSGGIGIEAGPNRNTGSGFRSLLSHHVMGPTSGGITLIHIHELVAPHQTPTTGQIGIGVEEVAEIDTLFNVVGHDVGGTPIGGVNHTFGLDPDTDLVPFTGCYRIGNGIINQLTHVGHGVRLNHLNGIGSGIGFRIGYAGIITIPTVPIHPAGYILSTAIEDAHGPTIGGIAVNTIEIDCTRGIFTHDQFHEDLFRCFAENDHTGRLSPIGAGGTLIDPQCRGSQFITGSIVESIDNTDLGIIIGRTGVDPCGLVPGGHGEGA